MGVPVPPMELTGNGTVFMHRTQAIRTEKGPPVLRPRIIPTPSPSIFVIKPISIIVTTLTAPADGEYPRFINPFVPLPFRAQLIVQLVLRAQLEAAIEGHVVKRSANNWIGMILQGGTAVELDSESRQQERATATWPGSLGPGRWRFSPRRRRRSPA
jgi:hypothetical protein